jgi:hypothetical protein
MCSMAISPDLTDYHAKYYAYELTRRYSADSLEKLASTFAGAKVDLNPHQLDAALFAFGSPLSKGALLADEVGLMTLVMRKLLASSTFAIAKTLTSLSKRLKAKLQDVAAIPNSNPFDRPVYAVGAGLCQPVQILPINIEGKVAYRRYTKPAHPHQQQLIICQKI